AVERFPGQSDRQFRGRRPGWGLRPHRPQNYRRHLWRLPAPRRRRFLPQGSHQSRPLGRPFRALSRPETPRPRHCRTLHNPNRLCHRRRRPDVAAGRYAWHRQGRREEARKSATRNLQAHADQHPPHAQAQPADLSPHRRLRPFRPCARQGRRFLLGENRPGERHQNRGGLILSTWEHRACNLAGVETAMSISDRSKARRSAFFGPRKGHALRPRQAELFDTLLPRLAIELARPTPPDLGLLFPNPVDSVCLEIGFGGGEHMIAQAEQHPRIRFIRVPPFVNGMAKALAAIDLKHLSNIRLPFDDAVFLLEWLPPASLACVDLIYPDPWPKRRHWKRRFIQDESVAAIARILRPGGEFRFATDVAGVAASTRQHPTPPSALT